MQITWVMQGLRAVPCRNWNAEPKQKRSWPNINVRCGYSGARRVRDILIPRCAIRVKRSSPRYGGRISSSSAFQAIEFLAHRMRFFDTNQTHCVP